jgi:hypothetical protein
MADYIKDFFKRKGNMMEWWNFECHFAVVIVDGL